MNSIFKRSKLDEMQEIKQLKIEHYGYWVLYGGLVVSIVVQAAQDAPLAQYLPEGILLVGTSAVMLAANLWSGLWDRTFQPSAGTNAMTALIAAAIAGAMNYDYLPGAVITAAFTWALAFAALQVASAVYKKRRKTLDDISEESEEDEK